MGFYLHHYLKTGPYTLKFMAGSFSILYSFNCAKMYQQDRYSRLLIQGCLHLGDTKLTSGYSMEPYYKTVH